MRQRNRDVENYKIKSGEYICSMYHERGILDVWENSHLYPIFSILHSNSNQCGLQIESLMHLKKFDVEYNKIHIGSCASSIYNGRDILDVWKICLFICHFFVSHSIWNHCCVFLLSFYHLDILIAQNESLYKWHCVYVSFDVRWIWSRAVMHLK